MVSMCIALVKKQINTQMHTFVIGTFRLKLVLHFIHNYWPCEIDVIFFERAIQLNTIAW